MVIYKAIRYKILEFCLDSLFTGIARNFSDRKNLVRLSELPVGTQIKQVEYNGKVYYNCIVEPPIFEIMGTVAILGRLTKYKDSAETYFCRIQKYDSSDPIIKVIEW
jgi:hypothetical protein